MDNPSSSDQAFRPAREEPVRTFPGGKVRLPRLDSKIRAAGPRFEFVGTAFSSGGAATATDAEAPHGFSGYYTAESLFDDLPEDLDSHHGEDPYHVLGCEPGDEWDRIAVAYRNLVKEFHPDRFVGRDAKDVEEAEHQIKRITHAYSTLRRARTGAPKT